MRHLLTTFLCLTFTAAFSQEANSNALLPDSTISKQITRKDSFVFAGKTYAIPRDCEGKDQSNCCSYVSKPDQLGCDNGTGLSWDYMQNLKVAAWNVESFASQMQQQQKTFKKEPITCYLLGKKVSGYAISCETKENHKWYAIVVSGEVDGRAMMVELRSTKKIKHNGQIQPVFRQILSLKS